MLQQVCVLSAGSRVADLV